jgi:hypothetical protein
MALMRAYKAGERNDGNRKAFHQLKLVADRQAAKAGTYSNRRNLLRAYPITSFDSTETACIDSIFRFSDRL